MVADLHEVNGGNVEVSLVEPEMNDEPLLVLHHYEQSVVRQLNESVGSVKAQLHLHLVDDVLNFDQLNLWVGLGRGDSRRLDDLIRVSFFYIDVLTYNLGY